RQPRCAARAGAKRMNARTSAAVDLGAARNTIECFDPATREPLGTVPVDDAQAVAAAVARARQAQRGWAESDFDLRRRVLRRVADHLTDHVDALCDVIVRDSGKTRENAL